MPLLPDREVELLYPRVSVGGNRRCDFPRWACRGTTFRFALGVVTRAARTLATIWCSDLPAAMSVRIAANTLPASSTAQGARCASCAGWVMALKGSSVVIEPAFWIAARKFGQALDGESELRLPY